ncbi:unnamed protein product, partial [Brenthis ino]
MVVRWKHRNLREEGAETVHVPARALEKRHRVYESKERSNHTNIKTSETADKSYKFVIVKAGKILAATTPATFLESGSAGINKGFPGGVPTHVRGARGPEPRPSWRLRQPPFLLSQTFHHLEILWLRYWAYDSRAASLRLGGAGRTAPAAAAHSTLCCLAARLLYVPVGHTTR